MEVLLMDTVVLLHPNDPQKKDVEAQLYNSDEPRPPTYPCIDNSLIKEFLWLLDFIFSYVFIRTPWSNKYKVSKGSE